MNAKRLLSLWGLKWNPFSPELPSEGLLVTTAVENFVWRVEQLVQEGGFALVCGESGTGKSVALRIVAERLAALRDVVVGVLQRPPSRPADFDAKSLLTVVLAGDGRLLERLRHPDLVPLAGRIRTRLITQAASREELSELLSHALAKAGNATLMTAELRETLVDHCAGNYRLLMTISAELLAYGMAHEVEQLDEKFYLEVFQPSRPRPAPKKKARI
jgi:type II secretory pathway predicted ATPase ExeA